MAVIFIIVWISYWKIAHSKRPFPLRIFPKGFFNQSEMIYQAVRKNAMQAYIKYRAYYDKKVNASKVKEAECVYILPAKADHQGSNIPFKAVWWLGPCISEKVLPNNNYLVRKIGSNKSQVLHSMRMRQFTPRQPTTDIRITPQQWKPDPEVRLKHDGLYARTWVCEYEKPICDAEDNNAMSPISSETPTQSDVSIEEMRNTPRTAQECSPEIFPHPEHLCDVTSTYPDIEPDLVISWEQPNKSPTKTSSSRYNLRHNTEPDCNDDNRY